MVYSQVRLWVLIGLFLLLSCLYLNLPGLNFDECLGAAPAVAFLEGSGIEPMQINPSIIQVFGRPLPLMVMTYIGPVKTILHILAYSVLGISVVATRLVPVLCVLGFLFVLTTVVDQQTGVGDRTLALLAVHPAVTIYLTRDVAPAAFAVLALSVVLWGFFKYKDTKKFKFLVLSALFSGFGVSHKADFVWVALSLMLAFLIYRVRLSIGQMMQLTGVFLLGAAPIVAFNLVTWGLTGQQLHSFILSDMPEAVLTRFKQFFDLLSTDWMSSYFTGTPTNRFFQLFCYTLVLFGSIFVRPKTDFQKFIGLTILTYIFLCSLTQFALHIHHLLVVIPLGLTYLSLHFSKMVITVLFLAFLTSSVWINYNLKQTGGSGIWSSSIYLIADDLKHHKGVNLCSHRYTGSLIVLSKGKLQGRRVYRGEEPDSTFINLYENAHSKLQDFP
jgi:hypothetical protein